MNNEKHLASLLMFAWQNDCIADRTVMLDGRPAKIASTGVPSDRYGDFQHVMIEISGMILVGNAKIMAASSDWRKLSADTQSGIDMLVVLTDDMAVIDDMSQMRIPVLKAALPPEKERLFEKLISGKNEVCSEYIRSMDRVVQLSIQERLFFERLENKCGNIEAVYRSQDESWNLTFFRLLFDTMAVGNKRNREMLNELADRIGVTAITNNLSSPEDTEALLMGVSGLLEEVKTPDEYILTLRTRFMKMKKQFQLKALDARRWNFSSRNQHNCPWIVLAQLAAILFWHKNMFFSVINAKEASRIRLLFETGVSEYWRSHTRGGELSSRRSKRILSDSRIDVLMINLVIPFLFVYNKANNRPEDNELILDLIENIPAEQNQITDFCMGKGIPVENAMHSQAAILLFREYCKQKKCALCPYGRLILTQKTMPLCEQIM